MLVAIADVAHYVRPGSPLDKAALDRGNSVYFPDRVVPMLPHELSNGWCSLVPAEDRPCLAAHLWIDAGGNLLRHRFERGMMRSAARLTYRQVQATREGIRDKVTATLADSVIAPLYGAYQALARARRARGVLELEMPERRVLIDADGSVAGIEMRERFDSHKLIEEFMIAANVGAAEALENAWRRCSTGCTTAPARSWKACASSSRRSTSRSHERLSGRATSPACWTRCWTSRNRAWSTRSCCVASPRPSTSRPTSATSVWRCSATAHFTSPIRRYADLLVHRALIAGCGWATTASPRRQGLSRVAEHISGTEREAMPPNVTPSTAYVALFLADRVGAMIPGASMA